jgi:hypothetical protein
LFTFMICSLLPCFAHHMAVVVNKDNNVGEVGSTHLARSFAWKPRNGTTAKM